MTRHIAGWIAHRWTKWVVLVVALVLTGIMGSLGAKLGDVEDNDIGSWLPGNAESTQVINKSGAFRDSDEIPAIVLYVREGGITPQDTAKAAADAKAFADVDHVKREIVGPIPSEDGKALQTIIPLNMGASGWNDLPDVADALTKIAQADANGLDVRLAGPAALGADQAD
ncbi:MAG: hypothetical protein JWP10_317, partial [Nocardioidaceae bacterium]|nr:hypothetical protein [Nocardioidaceae bacterium]